MKTELFPDEWTDDPVFDHSPGTTSMPGTEAFTDAQTASIMRAWQDQLQTDMFPENAASTMAAVPVAARPRRLDLYIRTTNHQDFRVYMPGDTTLTPMHINMLCRFLDSRKANETVTFILGSKINDGYAHEMGPMISAIQTCTANTIGIAAGYCSIPETMIWAFCKERKMYRYGALSIGCTDIIKVCPKYKHYFEVFFKRAVDIGIIGDEDVEGIWKNKCKFLLYQDLKNPI